MKSKIVMLIVLLWNVNLAIGQSNYSGVDKWSATCKIWGFIKYYHPTVASGQLDWDQELFEIIPKVKASQSKDELSKIFIDWIDELGVVKSKRRIKPKKGIEYFEGNFDLSWIDSNDFFSDELSVMLRFIEQNRFKGETYYAYSNRDVGPGNVKILNEKEYLNFDWGNENLRMLTLFRYWNIVEYFFPYKYQTDTPWNEVLIRMIPKFKNAKSEVELHLAMLELIVYIDDSHGGFGTAITYENFGNYFTPVIFKIIEDKAVVTGFWNDSIGKLNNLEVGDVISKVDGREVCSIFKEKEKYIYGSNIPRKKKNAFRLILNGATDSVEIEISRDGSTFTNKIARYRFSNFNYKYIEDTVKYEIIDGNIGYVNIGAIKISDVDRVMLALKDTKGIIFDMRTGANSTGPAFASYISSEKKEFYRVVVPDPSYPGKFEIRTGSKVGGKGKWFYEGKVILLVDENIQSHGEFSTMILQTGDNVTTIGSQTSGADGNTSKFFMVGGYKTTITGTGIFYPDGTITQRKGVKIDIEIQNTIEGVVSGKDEQLIRAIEFLKK